MEGDDGEAGPRRKDPFGGRQPPLELLQFLVHVDADRLEGPRRRVLLHPGIMAKRLAHSVGKLAGPRDRPRRDDEAGDAAGARLLAIMEEDVRDLALVRMIDEIG